MPDKHKTPLLGWHPPAELSAWARAEAESRGVPLSDILTAALEAHRVFPPADRQLLLDGLERAATSWEQSPDSDYAKADAARALYDKIRKWSDQR